MKQTAIVVGLMLTCGPSWASPLTDSIAADLQDKDLQVEENLSKKNYCDARHEIDDVVTGLKSALDQIADDQVINMPTLKSIHVKASPDDVTWISQRLIESENMQHSFYLFCPPG